MTAREYMKKKESEGLAELQDPKNAEAEKFIKDFLLQRFKIPEATINGKKYMKGVIIYENDCPEEYDYDVVRKAVEIAENFGLSAKLREKDGKSSCYFAKEI